MPPKPIDPAIRYHTKYDKRGPDECWPWTKGRFKAGYGAFWDGEKQTTAHRFGYKLLIAPVPPELDVCHTCDNPPCQNPTHWFLGTNTENTADRHQKGRSRGPRGELSGHVRLTTIQVLEIRRLAGADTQLREIARQYSLTPGTVSQIIHGKRWAHVTGLLTTIDKRTPLTADQVREIRRYYRNGLSQYKIAEMFSVSRPTVAGIVTRRYWKHITD